MHSFVTDVEFEAALSNSLQHFFISLVWNVSRSCAENCGAEARSFRNSTDWFREVLIFQLLPHLLNRLKELWKPESVCVLVVTLLVSIMKDQVERLVITVQKWTTRTTYLAQERQNNSGKFTPRYKQFPSCSTSASKTTLSWPDAASSSLFLNLFKTKTTGTLFPWGGFSNFLQKR